MTTGTDERIGYVDVARALAVIGVILGHAWYGSAAERITLSFDLALFFFLSGFLYSEKYSARPKALILRRLRTLYVPYVAWNLVYLALHDTLLRIGIYSDKTGYLGQPSAALDPAGMGRMALRILTFRGVEQLGGALWFLAALFITNVVFGLVSFAILKIAKRRIEWLRGLVVLGLAAAGYLSNPVVHDRAHIGGALVAMAVFYAGLLYRRYSARLRPHWYVAVPATILLIAAGGGVYFGSNVYKSPLLLVTIVPAGIYASMWAAERLQGSRLLRYIGKNTIFIVATHFLAFKLVSLVLIQAYGYPSFRLADFPVIVTGGWWWIAYFACGLLVPVAVKLGYDRAVTGMRRALA